MRPHKVLRGGAVTFWEIAWGQEGRASVGPSLYRAAGALKAFLETFPPEGRDEAATTIMDLPEVSRLWWSEDAKNRIGTKYQDSEENMKALSEAWLLSGGEAAIGKVAPTWVGIKEGWHG